MPGKCIRIFFAPNNAHSSMKEVADYILKSDGEKGIVRNALI